MGTMCLTNGRDGVVKCVDVMGVTVPAYPSATSVMIDTPPASAVPGTEPVISYSPTEAWNTTEANLSCRTKASTLHVTDVINATVSFNYSGPSVIVHTVKSSRGGLFAVFIDGFNTTSTIDTYRPPLDDPTEDPECFTVQFPPMRVLPPGFDSRTEHTISLVYQGPSSKPDDGPVDGSFVQFDSFSVPIFSASELDSSAAFGNMPSAFAILCSLSTVVASFML
ncbi:hypothetical protein CC2G_008069 [Coprinopsis cinerea AmutBmut pab1-1]|nr:hypothetical protein CC2G_008069 [Coprinopsis cinerea AmutBmut pab1-1]